MLQIAWKKNEAFIHLRHYERQMTIIEQFSKIIKVVRFHADHSSLNVIRMCLQRPTWTFDVIIIISYCHQAKCFMSSSRRYFLCSKNKIKMLQTSKCLLLYKILISIYFSFIALQHRPDGLFLTRLRKT